MGEDGLMGRAEVLSDLDCRWCQSLLIEVVARLRTDDAEHFDQLFYCPTCDRTDAT